MRPVDASPSQVSSSLLSFHFFFVFLFLCKCLVSFSLHDCIQATQVLLHSFCFLLFCTYTFKFGWKKNNNNDCIVNESEISISFRCSSGWTYKKTSACKLIIFRFLLCKVALVQVSQFLPSVPVLFLFEFLERIAPPRQISGDVVLLPALILKYTWHCASLIHFSKRTASAIGEHLNSLQYPHFCLLGSFCVG